GGADGNPGQQPRAQRRRPDSQAPQDPSRSVLQRQHVTAPGTEDAADEEDGDHHRSHQEKAGGDYPEPERLHPLVELERGQGATAELPMHEVERNQDMYAEQDCSTSAPPGARDPGCLGLSPARVLPDWRSTSASVHGNGTVGDQAPVEPDSKP